MQFIPYLFIAVASAFAFYFWRETDVLKDKIDILSGMAKYYSDTCEFYRGMHDKYYGLYMMQLSSVKLPLYMPWHMYPDEAPALCDEIRNYPVAIYHPEIGIYIDMAEYHGGWPSPWQLVDDGSAVEPFAWYDLPEPPAQPSPLYLASKRIAAR